MIITRENINNIIVNWLPEQKRTVDELIERWGLPDFVSINTIEWYLREDIKRTVIHKYVRDHFSPAKHIDFHETIINYRVPLEIIEELTRADGSWYIDRTAGEAIARCDSIGFNRLVLNVMHLLATKQINIKQSGELMVKVEKDYRINGIVAPEMEKFLFSPQHNTADPGVAQFTV